jgi:ABC-type lipoprotein export system ATPase subunit/GNAT superfamily N-acetyltransferase
VETVDFEQTSIFPDESGEVIKLHSRVREDETTLAVSQKFDYDFNGEVETEIKVPHFHGEFQIGLIVGSSGSGKSTLLKRCFGQEEEIAWDNSKSIVSNFDGADSGMELLSAVGLSSIPSWCKPYNVLSSGEKFRADLARRLHSNSVIDEFTSVVNRDVAKSCSYAVQKYIREHGLNNIVFASCHDDIAEYLQPDWIYNTDTTQFYNGRYLHRPPIELVFHRCGVKQWDMFKKHHYLSHDINKACTCYLVSMNDYPVGFVGSLAFPFGGCTNAWRESRLVVLPDFQGMGIGNTISETVAQMYLDRGCRYFSKTTNPRCGLHRDKSPLWRGTSHNHKARADYIKDGEARGKSKYSMSAEQQLIHANRVCYSHEYIGEGK